MSVGRSGDRSVGFSVNGQSRPSRRRRGARCPPPVARRPGRGTALLCLAAPATSLHFAEKPLLRCAPVEGNWRGCATLAFSMNWRYDNWQVHWLDSSASIVFLAFEFKITAHL